VDELRTAYSVLEQKKDFLIEKVNLIEQKIEVERALASENLDAGFYFNNFEFQQKEIIQSLQEEIAGVEEEMESVLELLRDHFKTQKNYDHLIKKLLEERTKKENLKEQHNMDEVSLRKFFFVE